MRLTDRVKQILSWYPSDNPGTQTNLARLLNTRHARRHGQAGHPPGRPGLRARSGALVRAEPRGLRPRLPLPARDRRGLQRLRGAARLPRGRRRQVRRRDPAHPQAEQLGLAVRRSTSRCSAVTGSVKDAVRLGCAAIGYTIYPGSGAAQQHVRGPARAHRRGEGRTACPPCVWAYPRGAASRRRARPAIDVIAYAAQIAAQLGAHVIKVKPPKDHIEQAEAKKVYEKYDDPDQDAGRARAPRRAERVQRQAHRHLLGRRGEGHRRAARGGPRHPRRRRLRLDHGPQRLPAPEGRGAQAPQGRDGHLPGEVTPSFQVGQCAEPVTVGPLSTPRHAAPPRCVVPASPHALRGIQAFRRVADCNDPHHAARSVQVDRGTTGADGRKSGTTPEQE